MKYCLLGAMAMMGWGTLSLAQTPVLNEIMSSNQLAHFDDFFESDDWVEIYNPGGLLDLAGHHISDDPTNLTKYTFPDSDPGSTFMTPGDHLLVWCDNDSVQGVLHANFKLSAENEGVWLTAPDGVTVLDSMVYPPQQTDVSFGRSCDGCEDWVFFNVPTPEASNVDQVLPTPALYLNEVLLDNNNVLIDENAELDAWIEVYNPNAFQVNLGGYTLSSSVGSTYTLPEDNPVETMVPAEGFLLLWMDGQPEQGGHHLGWSATNENQTFTLTGADGAAADTWEVQTSFSNVSFGRTTDGAPTTIWFDTPTPRVTNALLVVPPANVVINEYMTFNVNGETDGQGELEDWVEIHNKSTVPIDLAGYYLTDRLNNPTKWRIPVDAGDSTVIEGDGYMVLWADEDGGDGWNHMNFRLNNTGEVLVLRSPDGFSIADSSHFGTSEADQSFARLPNGVGEFVQTDLVTFGECNDCPDGIAGQPDARGAVCGANPIRPGGRLEANTALDVFDAQGRHVARIPAGGFTVPESWLGWCTFVSSKGRQTWLVVR